MIETIERDGWLFTFETDVNGKKRVKFMINMKAIKKLKLFRGTVRETNNASEGKTIPGDSG